MDDVKTNAWKSSSRGLYLAIGDYRCWVVNRGVYRARWVWTIHTSGRSTWNLIEQSTGTPFATALPAQVECEAALRARLGPYGLFLAGHVEPVEEADRG